MVPHQTSRRGATQSIGRGVGLKGLRWNMSVRFSMGYVREIAAICRPARSDGSKAIA
jgi:hypothetical protein